VCVVGRFSSNATIGNFGILVTIASIACRNILWLW